MERKKLIRITKNRIFLTTEMSLSLSQTSLIGSDLSFRTYQDIYFEIQVLDYDKNTNKISVEITDYEPKNIDTFKKQTAKAQVSFIHFKPLKWQSIEKHLSIYTKSILLREKIVIDDATPSTSQDKTESFSKTAEANGGHFFEGQYSILSEKRHNYSQSTPREPLIEKVTEDAKVYFKDIDFNLGFVTFLYKSRELNKFFSLKIENHFLLTEFNAIKSYFPKVFGGKKQFSINIIFTITDKVVTDIVTTSPEISSINEDILDSIKRQRVANLTSTPLRNSVDKSLFTAEDVFDNFEDNLKDGNIFKQSEEDILNVIIETRDIRNAKHLQFLAGSKHSTKQKLRFTLKPLFGFVFFIEGETKNHFCWELLDSHATYLWSFDKIDTDINVQFKRVEESINIIRDIGRENYKNNFRKKRIDSDLHFDTIEHRNINSALIDGFVEWQHRLKERLV